jgi:hypothetical protein
LIKYVTKFRVLAPIDQRTNKITSNKSDTYLLGKYNIQVYRWNKNTLCIYFPSGNSATNIILPLLDQIGVTYKLYLDADGESIYKVKESDIDKLHSVIHFQTKGKNISPFSVKTERKQVKKSS